MIMNWILPLSVGFFGGGLAFWFLSNYLGTLEKKRALAEAKEILDRAKDAAELIEMDQKELLLEIEEEIWTKAEPDLFKLEEHIEELEEDLRINRDKASEENSELKSILAPKLEESQDTEKRIRDLEQSLQALKNQNGQINNQCIEKLAEKLQSSKATFISQLVDEMVTETQVSCQKKSQDYLEEVQITAEQRAKRLLSIAIDRFARPFCPERGLGLVELPEKSTLQLFMDKERKNFTLVQELCGCDLILDEEAQVVNIAGFDPVRREWTRRTLEKIFKEKKKIDADIIRRKAADAKRELFKQIKQDGDNLARELGLRDLHPEIRQMMGSLRYRYSFTQNQYFHCSEVGWLCGLLAGELSLPLKLARRAGMLHDIGKSMDHAMEGGHAVIGADFIKERNESNEIVHAVRAHHFDEAPNSDLAYLVIAADAISGARPGARRSALESYNQKVTELETIALSFEGVDDCYILSGGREVRVIANEKALDDSKALTLSKELAQRIENEVSYPGQIKVVVVRNTVVQETTRV